METLSQPVIALFLSAVLISLFAVLRLATRSPSSPFWLTNTFTAYLIAVPLTLGFAVSLAYLGYSLAPSIGVMPAFLATFAIHMALLAGFRILLPIKEEAPVTNTPRLDLKRTQAAAA